MLIEKASATKVFTKNNKIFWNNKWNKEAKNELRKIWIKLLKNLKSYKANVPQILLCPFLNSLFQIFLSTSG